MPDSRENPARKVRGPYKPLTEEQTRIVREILASGGTQGEAARAAGIPVRRIRTRFADQLDGATRNGRGHGGGRGGFRDLSPEEIAIAAARLRATWSEARWLGYEHGDAFQQAYGDG